MALLVPDASVICKWALGGSDEPEQAAALEILSRWLQEVDAIILPSLWVYEVGNVVGIKRPDHAASIMDVLLDYQFEEAEVTSDLCRAALRLMEEHGATFYDAIYHALAIERGAVFITADKRYFKQAVAGGFMELLGECS